MKKQKVHESRPFDGKIRQLKKEHLILVNLVESREFARECFRRGIEIGVGSEYNGGVILYEK